MTNNTKTKLLTRGEEILISKLGEDEALKFLKEVSIAVCNKCGDVEDREHVESDTCMNIAFGVDYNSLQIFVKFDRHISLLTMNSESYVAFVNSLNGCADHLAKLSGDNNAQKQTQN
jgi:hypothetical protein